jgi:hypothetical protein
MATWRVGRKLGRTIYKDDVCVGMVDTPALAEEIVATMNGKPSKGASALRIQRVTVRAGRGTKMAILPGRRKNETCDGCECRKPDVKRSCSATTARATLMQTQSRS